MRRELLVLAFVTQAIQAGIKRSIGPFLISHRIDRLGTRWQKPSAIVFVSAAWLILSGWALELVEWLA